LSMFPLLSAWIIWVPVSLYMALTSHTFEALVVAIPHVITTYVIDAEIFKLVPGGGTTYVGLSVFLGIGAFGITGAILGPLLAGILGAILTIYKEYYFRPNDADAGHFGNLRRRTVSSQNVGTSSSDLISPTLSSPTFSRLNAKTVRKQLSNLHSFQ